MKNLITINLLTLVGIASIHSMEDSQRLLSLKNALPKIIINDFSQKDSQPTVIVLEQNHTALDELSYPDQHDKKNKTPWAKIVKHIESGSNVYYLSSHIELLAEAGTDPNVIFNGESLLHKAVLGNYEFLVKILLKHNADYEYEHFLTGPIFFDAQTIEIAQLFIDKGIDINTVNGDNQNVLWHIIDPKFTSDLMRFYLSKNVNVKHISQWDRSSILHSFAVNYKISNENNFLIKARLVVEACPVLINIANDDNETPIELAKKTIKVWGEKYPACVQPLKKLIALFEEYKGKI